MRTRYVLGLAFPLDLQKVVLMRKTRPAWQAGRLNAPGGKIDGDETPVAAMVREFAEETGVKTDAAAWDVYARMVGADFDVTVLKCFSDAVLGVRMAEDQAVELHDVHGAVLQGKEPIANIGWLVQAALDPDSGERTGKFVLSAVYNVATTEIS